MRDGAVDAGLLLRCRMALAHRGPDGHGDFIAEGVGLAHTRLSIIDLEGGAQPLHNEDRTIVLVCNGEIYNYVELRRELEAQGHVFETGSDSETIVHAYESWGLDFLQHVRGMFALALYDGRSRRLVIARDRLGIKPLFLAEDSEGLHFASELKALLPHLRGRPRLEPAALLEFLHSQYIGAEHTLVRGISKVLPGEVLVVEHGSIRERRRYYALPLGSEETAPQAELFERFDALMHEVMHEHMRSDVPFGLFLSGGIDSALLALMLSREGSSRLRTFSVGFAHGDVNNELAPARDIAQRFGTVHTEITVTSQDLLARLPFTIWGADELLGDTACLPTSLLAQRAGGELKVVFSGEGGDEVFAGYARYRAAAWKRWLRWLRTPRLGGMRSSGQAAGHEALFGDALRTAGDAWQRPQAQAWRDFAHARSPLQRMQAVDMATWLADDLLVKCDRMLMSYALEGRVPFLDHRVVEFGLALPDAAKVGRRFGKRFLREWGGRYLPHGHMWQRKMGFTVPVAQCLTGEVLDKLVVLLPANPGIREWFLPHAVSELVRRVRAGGSGARMVWSLLQFAIWHNLFVDGAGVRPPADCPDLAAVV